MFIFQISIWLCQKKFLMNALHIFCSMQLFSNKKKQIYLKKSIFECFYSCKNHRLIIDEPWFSLNLYDKFIKHQLQVFFKPSNCSWQSNQIFFWMYYIWMLLNLNSHNINRRFPNPHKPFINKGKVVIIWKHKTWYGYIIP